MPGIQQVSDFITYTKNLVQSLFTKPDVKSKFHRTEVYTFVVHIVVVLFVIYILYYTIQFITAILKKGCLTRCRFILQEGFDTNFETSSKYFADMSDKCDKINNNISTLSANVDDLEMKFGVLRKDICYVTNQVDESLAGNYASNVPDEEQQYPPDEQTRRASKRKESAAKYVTNLKKTFVETHNNTPLLECFENPGMTDDETSKLTVIRDDLMNKITEVKNNLNQFDLSMVNLQKEFAKDKINVYYTTLNYNDKYIKQMTAAITKAQSGADEGFSDQDDAGDTLDFKPTGVQDQEDPTAGPEQRINSLEEHYTNSAAMFNKLARTYTKYNNTIKQQAATIKQAKLVVNDKDEQNRQMNANAGKAVKSS